MNICSEIWQDTWGDGLDLFQRPPAHTLCPPIIEVISCVQDQAMSKQKPYAKNKNLGSFTNSELSKQKVFKKYGHN